MNVLTEVLLEVSNALLIPVVVVLLVLAAWSLAVVGGALREWLDRRAGLSGEPRRGLCASFAVRSLVALDDALRLRALADEFEIDVARRLSRLQLGARLGPMLGLMGTLIPLGPALIGFADGRVDQLASQLVVAFSTTVVGLFAGGLCFAVLHVRRHWYALDLAWIDERCARIESGGELAS